MKKIPDRIGDRKGVSPDPEIRRLETLAEILDNKFVIPGTRMRFGIDSVIGLIPFAGDIFTFIISAWLLVLIHRRGSGSKILYKMTGNIMVDLLFGSIPVIGDIFDFRFRANIRNIRLMKEHLGEGKHKGSALPAILMLLILLLFLIALIIWSMISLLKYIFI